MKIPMSSIRKPYIVFVNHEEFIKAAYDQGYEYVVFYDDGIIPKKVVYELKKFNKAALLIYYVDKNDELPFHFEGDSFLEKCDFMDLSGMKIKKGKARETIDSFESAVRLFPSVDMIEKRLAEYGLIKSTDYTNRCGNCHAKLKRGDKFCRYCGTPRGEGLFEPYENELCTVYGPPILTKHECLSCGYKWQANDLGGDNARYCPKCRGELESEDYVITCGGMEKPVPFFDDEIEADLGDDIETHIDKKIDLNRIVYQCAIDFLNDIKPEGVNLENYYISNWKEITSLKDVFVQFIASAQNYQRMPNVIKFNERKPEIAEYLHDFDYMIVKDMSPKELYDSFREMFNIRSKDSKYNSWQKWSNSIVDSAKFVSEFKDVDDFKSFVGRFDYNTETRMALPLLISKKISGIGFALACDLLKELGFTDYPKPDVHLMDVFSALGLSENDEISTFEAIVRMSEICMEFDPKATPYKVDKVFWLICSGKFNKDSNEINIGRHKDEFIEYARRKMAE